MSHQLLADFVVALHVGYVAVVFFGLILILLGRALGWKWIANRWFRGIHLAMIIGVVLRALIWEECPLSVWEYDLRGGFDPEHFEGSPVGYYLHALIHPKLPAWVFPVVYVSFGTLILAAVRVAPVNWKGSPLPSPTGEEACPPIPPGPASAPPSANGGVA